MRLDSQQCSSRGTLDNASDWPMSARRLLRAFQTVLFVETKEGCHRVSEFIAQASSR